MDLLTGGERTGQRFQNKEGYPGTPLMLYKTETKEE